MMLITEILFIVVGLGYLVLNILVNGSRDYSESLFEVLALLYVVIDRIGTLVYLCPGSDIAMKHLYISNTVIWIFIFVFVVYKSFN